MNTTKKYLISLLEEFPIMEDYITKEKTRLSLMDDEFLSISKDKRISILEKNFNAIRTCFKKADNATKTIIKELYLKKYSTLNITGVSQKVFLSERQIRRKRDQFLEELYLELY